MGRRRKPPFGLVGYVGILDKSGISGPKIQKLSRKPSGNEQSKIEGRIVSTSFTSFGWKHGGIPVLSHGSGFDYPSAPLAFIVKTPYAFVVSLHRYHMRNVTHGAQISIAAEKEFDAFLCRPVVISDSQLSHSPQMRFHNPLQYTGISFTGTLKHWTPGGFGQ